MQLRVKSLISPSSWIIKSCNVHLLWLLLSQKSYIFTLAVFHSTQPLTKPSPLIYLCHKDSGLFQFRSEDSFSFPWVSPCISFARKENPSSPQVHSPGIVKQRIFFFSLWPDFANLQVLLFKSATWLAWGNSFGNGLTWKSKKGIWMPLWHGERHTVCGQLELALQERSCCTETCGLLTSFLFFKKKKVLLRTMGAQQWIKETQAWAALLKLGGATLMPKMKTTLVSLAQKFGRIEPNEKGEHLWRTFPLVCLWSFKR